MMIRFKGIKRTTVKGHTYLYHRGTRKRILSKPGSAAFAAEVVALDAQVSPSVKTQAVPESWGWLAEKYRASLEFSDKASATKISYLRTLDILRPMDKVALRLIEPPDLVKVRNKIAGKRGRRTANLCLQVLSLIFAWGIQAGHCKNNPAKGVRKLPRDKSAPLKNRRWQDSEITNFLADAPFHLALPVVIAVYTGLREGDVLNLTWTAVADGRLRWQQRKTGAPVEIPLHSTLSQYLARAPRISVQVCTTSKGMAWTASGFRASLRKMLARLVKQGRVQPGLTFHGLRHTVAARLAEAGADTRTIMAITGHTSESMVAAYTRQADQSRRAKVAVGLLEEDDP